MSVSHLKNEFWSGVDLLIIVLDNASSFLGVEPAFSIPASPNGKVHSFEHDEHMREHKHASLSKDDTWSQSSVPLNVKFNKHANEYISLAIGFISLLRGNEAILGNDD